MTSRTLTLRSTAVVALAVTIVFGLTSVSVPARAEADPAGAAAPGWAAGHARGEGLVQAFRQLKPQLNLDTSQQAQWDAAVAATRDARREGKALRADVHATTAAEMGKPAPDLQAIATASASAAQRGTALRQSVRESWLTLYATLSPEQKAMVADTLRANMAHRPHAVSAPDAQ